MANPKLKSKITIRDFYKGFSSWFGLTFLIFAVSLSIGILGYHYLGQLIWVDAFLNASMILGGMGPVDVVTTNSGKIFSACYALYSGLFLVVVGGLLLVPVFHHVLHIFHEDD